MSSSLVKIATTLYQKVKLNTYCLSKMSWPILYCKLLYKLGQIFLEKQYVYILSFWTCDNILLCVYTYCWYNLWHHIILGDRKLAAGSQGRDYFIFAWILTDRILGHLWSPRTARSSSPSPSSAFRDENQLNQPTYSMSEKFCPFLYNEYS